MRNKKVGELTVRKNITSNHVSAAICKICGEKIRNEKPGCRQAGKD